MKKLNFHHIGVACKDIAIMKDEIKKLFNVTEETETVYDPEQEANLSMLTVGGGLKIELIEGKPVENLTKKNISYYHLCFTTDDLSSALKDLVEQSALLLKPAKPAVLFGGKPVAFLHTKMGLIELLEEKQ